MASPEGRLAKSSPAKFCAAAHFSACFSMVNDHIMGTSFIPATALILVLLASCDFGFTPRNVDGKKAWAENQGMLKSLADRIISDTVNYKTGYNALPEELGYPFDGGFINYGGPSQNGDRRIISIKFYTDRGFGDHYSAIIFSNDPREISILDSDVRNGGNDFKLEDNWYLVNE